MSRYFVQEVYGKRFSGVNPKGYFASPALSIATSYDFWHSVADVFDDF